MLPRDSQFSTTPFVFPLFTLGLSHAFSSPFHTICNFPASLVFPLRIFLPPSVPWQGRLSFYLPIHTAGSLYLVYAFPASACLEANSRETIIIVKRADRNARMTLCHKLITERYSYIFMFNYPFKYVFVKYSITHIQHFLLIKLQDKIIK